MTIKSRLNNVFPTSGDDIIVSYGQSVGVIYWESPAPVKIDLRTGTVQDGYGNIDQLNNVRNGIGTRFNDVFIASDFGSNYAPNGGSDTVTGGAGFDIVSIYIDSASDFLGVSKKSKTNLSDYDLNYQSQGQIFSIALQAVEKVSVSVAVDKTRSGYNEFKSIYLSSGIEEVIPSQKRYFIISEDQFLGDYKFERVTNLHIVATNLRTNATTDLGPDYAGIKHKDQTFYFNEVGMLGDKIPWFHTVFTDPKTGDELLLLSTLSTAVSGGEALLNSPPSPVIVYGVKEGSLKDLTSQFFSTIPQTYWTRDIHVGDINGDGLDDVFFSSQGREVGSVNEAPEKRVNPVWGERNQLFFGSSSGWTDASSKLPNTVDFSHGSSLADYDGDGRDEIIVNNLGFFDGFPNRYILKWNNDRLEPVYLKTLESIESTFTLSGDINLDGFDDVVVGSTVFWGGNDFGNQKSVLPITRNWEKGFTNWHGGHLADFNGDGYPDILKISASDGSASDGLGPWQGLKMDLFFFSTQGWVDASANFSNYIMDQLGINVTILDLDFDGHLDILTSGPRYVYGQADKVSDNGDNHYFLRNDGTGNFQLIKLSLENPQYWVFFLKSANGTINAVSIEGNGGYVYSQTEQLTPEDVHRFVGEYGAGQFQVPGFDSQYYLNTYPEVINLIGNGIYTSAIDHYLKSGQALGNYSFAPGSVVWGTSRADIVVLREGNETAKLGNGNDRVEGRAGNDTLDGGDGVDEALYDGPSQVYSIAKQSGNTWHVTDQRASIQVVGGPQSDGIDQLANIERLKFLDKSLAIDLDGNSGNAARILATVFGKDAIKNPTYAGIAISLFDQGLSKDQVSQVALNAVYGANPKSKDIISMIWKNLTGSAIDDKSLADLSGLIDSKAITAAQLATKAADLDLTAQVIDLVGLSKAGWEYVPFGG